MSARRLSAGQRTRRLAGASGVVMLALLVLLVGDPTMRGSLATLLPGAGTAPTPTPEVDTHTIYLLPVPRDVDVQLDGRSLGPAQLADPSQPLHLDPGRHTLTWRANELPFLPLRCTVSMPHAASDTCPIVTTRPSPSPAGHASTASGTVIAIRESLQALSPADADALRDAIRQALAALDLTADLQPGDHFNAGPGSNGRPRVVAASEPLHARLTYRWVDPPPASEPCQFDPLALPCRFPGQDCATICMLPDSYASGYWLAAIPVRASWTFTRENGSVVASGVDERLFEQIMVLSIGRFGGMWNVYPFMGNGGSIVRIATADDLACDPGRDWLARTNDWRFMLTKPPPGAQVKVATDHTPADGCLISLQQDPTGHAEPALFLAHFGAMVAVNGPAVGNPPADFPSASVNEQQVAQRLAANLAS